MKIKLSRKILYQDNCRMQLEIDALINKNMHLLLAAEKQREELLIANDRIMRANCIIDKENFKQAQENRE